MPNNDIPKWLRRVEFAAAVFTLSFTMLVWWGLIFLLNEGWL